MTDATERTDNIDAIFEPRSVAVIGASANPGKHGHRLLANLKTGDPDRSVYPITRSGGPILGIDTYRNLGELPEAPDLVLVSIPAEGVPAAIAEAAAVGARAAIVFACGFAEAGDEGKALQQRMLDEAMDSGLRVVGPNCMGVYDVRSRLRATYYTTLPSEPGHVGFISQSGAFAGVALAELSRSGVGLSRFASIGNMVDVTHAELIRYLGSDPLTHVVAAFVEGAPDGADLLDAITEVSELKPVVILKGARTHSGRLAAASHTGALAGEGRVWDCLLREAGALVAEDTEDLFDAAATLVRMGARVPRGNRVGIVTISGGPAVVAADSCETDKLALPNLSDRLAAIRPLVPAFSSLANPVDLTSMTQPKNYAAAVAAVAELDDLDSVLAINVGLDQPEFAEAFVQVWETTAKPVVAYLVGETIERIFGEAGIPNLPTVERAVRAVARLVERAAALGERDGRLSTATYNFEPAPLGPAPLDEHEAKQLLAAHGVPVTRESLVRTVEEAVAAAADIGYPVVVKVCDAALLHKTQLGGVIVDVRDESSLRAAWSDVADRFPGRPVLVSEMVRGDIELIVGGRRDTSLGPIIMLGVGGIYVEALNDVTFARVPVVHSRARRMASELRSQGLLAGARGGQVVDRVVLSDLLELVSAFLVAHPEIVELDLNPVIVSGDQVVVADAAVVHGAAGA